MSGNSLIQFFKVERNHFDTSESVLLFVIYYIAKYKQIQIPINKQEIHKCNYAIGLKHEIFIKMPTYSIKVGSHINFKEKESLRPFSLTIPKIQVGPIPMHKY
jgi:hypothetical protein